MANPLLRSLDFTKSIGNLGQPGNVIFNDATAVGGFPAQQIITGITNIHIFATGVGPDDVIEGLTVTYLVEGGAPLEIIHGNVDHVEVGAVLLDVGGILVGASGQLKNTPAIPNRHQRISLVYFSVFHGDTGVLETVGPFGNGDQVHAPWGTFGPIIAFQGTTTPALGITSLGFVKLLQGVPGFGIFAN